MSYYERTKDNQILYMLTRIANGLDKHNELFERFITNEEEQYEKAREFEDKTLEITKNAVKINKNVLEINKKSAELQGVNVKEIDTDISKMIEDAINLKPEVDFDKNVIKDGHCKIRKEDISHMTDFMDDLTKEMYNFYDKQTKEFSEKMWEWLEPYGINKENIRNYVGRLWIKMGNDTGYVKLDNIPLFSFNIIKEVDFLNNTGKIRYILNEITAPLVL